MSIYTRQGDSGWTRDAAGNRVRKDSLLMEAEGALDELVSVLGWLGVVCPENLRGHIVSWQDAVYRISSWITAGHEKAGRDEMLSLLERTTDHLAPEGPSSFILPGGTEAASRAHIARTVCRRAERRVLAAVGEKHPALAVVNRLSDALFAFALRLNRDTSVDEIEWKNR